MGITLLPDFLDDLFPKKPEPYATPGQKIAAALARLREERANQAANLERQQGTAAAPAGFAPDVTAAHHETPSLEPPPVLRAARPETEADREAQREADREFAEAARRKEVMRAIGPVGRTAFAAGRNVAELAQLPASLAGRDTPLVSEPLRREAALSSEGLIKPGEGKPTHAEEMAGGFVGSLPAFELGGAVAGPITRALARRLVQRGVGKLGGMAGRSLLRGAEGLVQRGAEIAGGSALQGVAAATGAGESVPQALEAGGHAALSAFDPRNPLNMAFLAHGAVGGLAEGAGEHITYRDRLKAVKADRAAREQGFGPILPEEMRVRRRMESYEQEARRPPPRFPIEERGAPEHDINVPLEPPPSKVPPTPREAPRPVGPLPEGAPTVLGGSEAELEANRPRRGEPGVLASGPIIGGRAAELAAAGVGAAAGIAQGQTTEDKLLGALLGATVGSGTVASLRGARGLHSGPLIGGPEAGPNAPFFSRLGRALEALPESGASPQRLESLYRSGAFSKNEYDFVLAHQLEGREPAKNIPKADLMQLYERQALRLRANELPESADPAKVARHQEVAAESARLGNEIVQNREAMEAQFSDALPPDSPMAAKWWRNNVRHSIHEPEEVVAKVQKYEEAAAFHGTKISWKREAKVGRTDKRLIVTVKRPGKPPIRLLSGSPYWSPEGVLNHKEYPVLGDYLGDHGYDDREPGELTVDRPPLDPAKKAQLLKDAERLQSDHDELVAQFRAKQHEMDALDNQIHGKAVKYDTHGNDTDTAGRVEPNSYREWLLSLDRPAPFELPHNWTTRQREGTDGQPTGVFEVRNQGGKVVGTGDTRGAAVWHALEGAGETELLKRFHSGHWTDLPKDNLFHVRADVRTAYNTETGQPERVLFIREIQSDYFQAGHQGAAGYEGMVDQRTGKIVAMPRGHRIAALATEKPNGNTVTNNAVVHELPPDVHSVIAQDPNHGYVLYTRAKVGAPWEVVKRGENPMHVFDVSPARYQAVRPSIPRERRQGHLETYATPDFQALGWKETTPEHAQQAAERHVHANAAPAAPWRQTEDWAKLAVRHIVQKAVSQGLRHIVWTPGSLNSWARQYGFAKFYDEIIPRAFRDVGKELGADLSFEPAPLTKKAANWKVEPIEPDALSPEHVAAAWKQVSSVAPWVIQRSQVMRQVIGAMDELFQQSGEHYQPVRPEGEPFVPTEVVYRAVEQMMDGEFPNNGLHLKHALDDAGLGEAVTVSALRQLLDNSVANSASKRHLLEDLGIGEERRIRPRTVGATSHTPEAVQPQDTILAHLQRLLKERYLTDQAKVALLNVLGVRRVGAFEYGPQYHSVRLPEDIEQKTAGGFRMYGGVPFDPEWFKAVGLPAAGAAIGAGVGVAAAPDDETKGGLLGRALIGATVGAMGGRTFRDVLAARRARPGAEAGAAPVMPIEEAPAAPQRPDLRLVQGDEPLPEAEQPAPQGERQRLAPRPGGLPVEPPVNPADYANFAKFDLDPTGKTRLEAEVERLVTETGVHPKKVVSWAEVRRAADQLGLDVNAEGTQVNRRISGARLLAIRNILSANIAKQEEWAGELADATISPERRAQLERQSGTLDSQNGNLLGEFVRARSSAGRELNALKIVASRTLDPNVWWVKARQLANRDLTGDELANIRRLLSERDRAGLISYVAKLRESPVSEQLTTLWKVGLLTNPKTHIVNISGNTVFAGLELAKDPVAAGSDWLLSLWTKQRAKGGLNRFLVGASVRAVGKALGEAGEVMRGRAVGEELERGSLPRETQIDLPGLGKGANALLDGYQKYIFRALGAADRVYFHMALTRSLTEQASLAGRRMGMRGVQLREYVQGILRGEGPLADQITAQGLKDAAVATFRDETRLGRAASAFAREVPGGQFIVPFQRTPGAVATRILEYSPLGLGKGVVDAIKVALKGKNAPPVLQRMAAEELGRGVTGSGLIYLGYWLAQNGVMTGAVPTTGSRDRQQWIQEGRRPNALKVGDQWLEIGRLSPVGNLIALGANFQRALGGEGVRSLADPARLAELGFAGLRTVADQPFVTGASQALNALQDPEREAARFAYGLAGSMVPAGIGAVARGTDVPRNPELDAAGPLGGVAGAVVERIPGLRKILPARRDQFGRQQPSPGLINALFNPATAAPDLRAKDPVIHELSEAKYAVPRLPRDKGEGAHTYELRQRVFGTYTRGAIVQLLGTAEYGNAIRLEQQIAEQARALVNDPRFAGHSVERIQEALMLQAKAEKGAHTRAELLDREVSRVRAQLRKALKPAP